jgi:hypothetical protein
MEGFSATCNHSPAKFCGEYEAYNFIEACWKWICEDKTDRIKHFDIYKGRPYYWACGFYDNEEDARRSFG